MSEEEEKTVDRHILVIDAPRTMRNDVRSPSRGDLENIIPFDYGSEMTIISLLKEPGKPWKRGLEYVYGPKDKKEQVEQVNKMIRQLKDVLRVLQKEIHELMWVETTR